MFEKGDKIVYPMYGAGIIEDIVADGDTTHYIIRISNGSLVIKLQRKR